MPVDPNADVPIVLDNFSSLMVELEKILKTLKKMMKKLEIADE